MLIKSKIPKIVSGTLAAILIAVVSYLLLPPVWFWIGFEVPAALLVAVGCIGEWILFHHPVGREKREKEQHRKFEARFILAVAAGVTMEFFALAHAIPEAIKLEKEVAIANGLTVTNALQVAVLSNQTVRLSINLEEQKSNNLEFANELFGLAKQAKEMNNSIAQVQNVVSAPEMAAKLNEVKASLAEANHTMEDVKSVLTSSNLSLLSGLKPKSLKEQIIDWLNSFNIKNCSCLGIISHIHSM